MARLSHEGTQLRVTGTDRLLCEAVQALSQTAWVQIPVLWLTSHAVISSLPSVSISPEQRLQKYFLPLGILCGLNELIQVKHLEHCLTRSKCLINGGCLCSILHVPCVPVALWNRSAPNPFPEVSAVGACYTVLESGSLCPHAVSVLDRLCVSGRQGWWALSDVAPVCQTGPCIFTHLVWKSLP